MKNLFILSVIQILLLLAVPVFGTFELRIAADRLSVHAEQVPLKEIVERIVSQGVRVRIDPNLNPKITAFFENRDIQDGLGSILKSLDHVLIWAAREDLPGSPVRLREIRIFERGKKGSMKLLDNGSNLMVIKNPIDGSLYVKDEILLTLKSGMSRFEFMKFLKQIGGTVVDFDAVPGVYRIRLPENSDVSSIVDDILSYPGVTGSEPNYAYPIMLPYKGAAKIEISSDLSVGRVKDGAAPIAILDSGLRPDAGLGDIVFASLDAMNPGAPITDSLGHGTQMALIAAGAVKPFGVNEEPETSCPIVPIRAFDDNGFTSSYDLMKSVNFALDKGARVMSLSWGSETSSDFLAKAFEYAKSKGLFIVASAGNEPTGKPVYPAAYPSVIGIGALGPDGKQWQNSNYGDFVELEAPGFAKLPVGYNGEPGIYAGTSISAAYVARFISHYLSKNPGATNKEIKSALRARF